MDKGAFLENVDQGPSLKSDSSSGSNATQCRMSREDESRVVEMEKRSSTYLIHLTISTGG